MNELRVFNFNDVDVISSREVAEMTGRSHQHIMRDIRNYEEVLEKSTASKFGVDENANASKIGLVKNSNERNFAPVDFFIPGTYKDGKGETRPCYFLTKKGCDMVANKMTGEKGVLFTAAYVSAFEKMRQRIQFPALPKDYPSALRALADSEEQRMALEASNATLAAENERQAQVIAEFEPIRQYVDIILESPDALATSQIAADYGMSAQQLNKILRDEGVQHKVNGQWLLYKKHMNKGYTKSKTFQFTHSDGRADTKLHTQWTQKGRLMIHNILEKRGIVAMMDRGRVS